MGVLLRSCCLCFSPTVATFAIGSVGILLSCIFLVPLSIFLDNHTFYITEFARSQRDTGNYLDDDQVPAIIAFSKVLYTVLLCMDVTYIFSCILLLVGVATKRYQLMLPWLVYMFLAILVVLTLVISFIIGLPDYASLAVFLASSPVLLITAYLWLVVASAYQIIKAASKPDSRLTASASQSSLDSLKGGIQRVLGGTPPPPYQAVRTEPGSPGGKCRRKYARQISNESNTSDTVFFDVSSTRRSSEMTPSTKPASPVPLFQQQPSPPSSSSGGGIIQRVNPGSHEDMGNCQQDVGSYQQHCITMISPEGPSSSDPAATGGGASDHGSAKSFGHTQRFSHSNISLDDQQLQVSGGRRPGRSGGHVVRTGAGGQLKNSATLPHLQPLHTDNPGKGCRRSTQSVSSSSNKSRESVNMKRRSTANIETETNRDAHNISASIKDSKDSKKSGSGLITSTATAQDNNLQTTRSSSISDTATSSISTTSLDSTNILV